MRCVWLLVSCACTSHAAVVTLPTASASAVSSVAMPPVACALAFEPARELAIPARLDRLGPQYFHPSGREGFNDLIAGTSRYAWFDPANLDVAIEPPVGWNMIRRSTPSFFFGWASDGSLHVARRSDGATAVLPTAMIYDEDAVDDAHGAWLLAGDNALVRLVRVRTSLESASWDLAATPGNQADRQIAETSGGRVAVVWIARASNGLDLMASWLGPSGFAPALAIDHAAMSADAADLSLRTTLNLRAATDGDGVAVAWRPLVPVGPVDVGSQLHPPLHPTAAEVRIVTFAPNRPSAPARVHATIADTLGFTTGIGPWPLEGNGMTSSSVRGHAFFAWIEKGAVVVAEPRDASPRVISRGAPRLLPRPSRDGVELLLLSVESQSLVPVVCR